MRTLVHISDLHFGTEEKSVAEDLLKDIDQLSPSLVIVSGDLTQRARNNQFIAAKEYLEKIKYPKLIIPGNHDIPLFDLFNRFFFPLKRFKKYIKEKTDSLYLDEEIAVFALNSARSFTWKNGRISIKQIEDIEKRFCPINDSIFKIIVTHHPFIPPPGDFGIALIGRSVKALNIIDKCKIDMLLAGHLHQGYSGDIRPYYPSRKRSVISAQAGTAISNRIREEPNAFNFISVDKNSIKIEIREWNGEKFVKTITTIYNKVDEEWVREE